MQQDQLDRERFDNMKQKAIDEIEKKNKEGNIDLSILQSFKGSRKLSRKTILSSIRKGKT